MVRSNYFDLYSIYLTNVKLPNILLIITATVSIWIRFLKYSRIRQNFHTCYGLTDEGGTCHSPLFFFAFWIKSSSEVTLSPGAEKIFSLSSLLKCFSTYSRIGSVSNQQSMIFLHGTPSTVDRQYLKGTACPSIRQ